MYDDIVVGAGSTGAVIASRLSERGTRSVLLLEAGPDYPSSSSLPSDLRWAGGLSLFAHDWGYEAEPVSGRNIRYPSGKVTGGCSAVNACIALRGMPQDYDEWAELGCPEWSWARVLPAFIALEGDEDEGGEHHGKRGPVPICRWQEGELLPLQKAFRDACRDLGFPAARDHNAPGSSGVGPWPMNRKGDVRVSMAMAYLDSARDRSNLTIRAGCLVDRIVFEAGRAVGLLVEGARGREELRARRIILSAGAIGTPALLLRSGIGPHEQLRMLDIPTIVDLPGVGRNLSDHPQVGVTLVPKAGVCDTSQPAAQVGLLCSGVQDAEPNALQVYLAGHADISHLPELMAFAKTSLVFSVMCVLQRPHSRGQVELVSRDPRVAPRILLNYLSEVRDVARLLEGLELAWRISRSPQLTPFIERTLTLNDVIMKRQAILETYLRMSVNTIYHPVGTARMGKVDDPMSVVDQYGRVRGVPNLHVADASIMPSIPRANTNLTCVMLGERVAAWLDAASP